MLTAVWPDEVTWITSLEDVSPVFRVERAIVFMSVDWSGPERKGRQRLRQLIEGSLASGLPPIEFFVVNEDNDTLRARFPTSIRCNCTPLGAGAMHWIEHGRIVASEPSAGSCTLQHLMAQTAALWRPTAHAGIAP
jgi:hypothetical protein